MSGVPVRHVPAELVDRLGKVAGLLGSDHAGERSAAAYRATALIRAVGLTWRDLIEAAGPRYEPPPAAAPPPWSWRAKVATCRERRWMLTDWEAQFILSLAGHRKALSRKQQTVLDRIHAKVTAP